jgi:hypothetical protein
VIPAPWSHLKSAQRAVGRRLRLYWGGDRKWYSGKVCSVHPRTRAALVQYTDLEEKWHCLWEEKFEWLDEQPSAVRAAELRGVRVK